MADVAAAEAPSLVVAANDGPGEGSGFLGAATAVACLVALPIIALALIAAQGSGDLWPHLIAHVLPQATLDTAVLLLGVGAVVVFVGAGAAWLVTAYDFPGRKLIDWALLLPLAVPTYIVAFAYLDVLHPVGPVQTTIRGVLGLADPRDLWFPEVRSMAGCILLLGFVLYPYVYLPTRAMFLMQAASLVEVARTLGAGEAGVFWRVALPLARPAIAVGASLALLEALNDIGASEFLGVRTLTVSIYSTWVNRSNLPGAAQIALVMLAVVLLLLVLERRGRRRQRYAVSAQRARRMAPRRLTGAAALAALLLGGLPIVIGFVVPASYLIVEAARRVSFAGVSPTIVAETLNTLAVSVAATSIALALGIAVAYARRVVPGSAAKVAARVGGLGYALPGTVLAIGLLVALAAIDNAVDGVMRGVFGVSTGLILSASGVALVYAYVARFLTITIGGIEAGMGKIPPSLDQAGRTLGETAAGNLLRIHLPLLRPAAFAAALLVFVDCMKELPATLILRPLNFETLATHLYGEAARGTYEDGALAALLIVLVGLLPVILLARIGRSVLNGNGGR